MGLEITPTEEWGLKMTPVVERGLEITSAEEWGLEMTSVVQRGLEITPTVEQNDSSCGANGLKIKAAVVTGFRNYDGVGWEMERRF